jgi:hypothetical protein
MGKIQPTDDDYRTENRHAVLAFSEAVKNRTSLEYLTKNRTVKHSVGYAECSEGYLSKWRT